MFSGNTAELLTRVAEKDPDLPAIVWTVGGDPTAGLRYERLTFEQLENKVARLTGALRRNGLRRGDRAIVFVPMSAELYLFLLAILRVGAVVVFLDPWCSADQMATICRIVEPSWFVAVPKAFWFVLRHKVLRSIPNRVSTSKFFMGPRMTLDSLIEEGGGDAAPTRRTSADHGIITFTSGTTGRPKGADRTHGFLLAQHEVLSKTIGYRRYDVDLPAFPIFTLNNLAMGVTTVVPLAKFGKGMYVDPATIVAQIEDQHVTTTAFSPAHLFWICDYLKKKGRGCESIRLVVTGGGPVFPATLGMMKEVFPKAEIMVAYGSTEAEPIAHIGAEEILSETAQLTAAGKGNCVGRPVEEIDLRLLEPRDGVIDPEETPLADLDVEPGAVGEIVIAGCHVNRSYFKDPEATRANKIAEGDGTVWHRTGDLGYADEKGRLWLVGRIKNRIVRKGQNYYPIQVEAAVETVEGIDRAAFFGVPHPAMGEAVHVAWVPQGIAFADLRDGERRRIEDAIRAIFDGNGWLVDGIHAVSKFPKDSRHSSKTDYKALLELFLQGKL